ncbi:hypothetical protein ACWEWP_19725 [Streptomyces olivaceus]
MEDPSDQTAHPYYSTPCSDRELDTARLEYKCASSDVQQKQVADGYGMSVEQFEALIGESVAPSPGDD